MSHKATVFFVVLGITAALVFLRPLLAPLALAGFLALLLHPLDAALKRHVPGRLSLLASLLTLAIFLAGLSLLAGAILLAASSVTTTFSDYGQQIATEFTRVRASLGHRGVELPAPEDIAPDRILTTVGAGLDTVLSIAAALGLALFFLLFFLQSAGTWRDKAAEFAIGDSSLAEIAGGVGGHLRTYLRATTLANLLSGLLSAGLLAALGIDHALVWGLLVFLLAYLPTIGAVFAAIPPILIAYFDHSPQWALVVFVAIGMLEQVTGAYLVPRVQGRALAISPIVLLASLIFWTLVWGGAGAILAVPLTLVAVGFAEQVPALRPLLTLIRDEARGD